MQTTLLCQPNPNPDPTPKQITPLWHDFTRKIMADSEAVQHLGWVREMWG